MAYNHGREDRKWRIWKEAEEKLLRECGVDEATIEQIRMADRADFNSNRRFYRWTNDVAEYLEDMAGREQLAKETIPDVLFRLVDFMRDKEEWIGTATELLAAMGETETIPTVITKWLNEYRTTFLSENRICYQYSRRKDGRRIALARRAGDSGDGGDSDIRIPPLLLSLTLKAM